ncbi:MAG: hypothetical protein WAU45_14080 [Blastocatellia bacterium]
MRTSVNLSSRPFTNHRLFWIVIGAVFFSSLWFFLWVVAERSLVIAKADQIKERIESQKSLAEAKRAEREKKEREQVKIVINEQEALELASARRLILEKSFSWNRMISELEQLIPNDARITAIKVEGISDAEVVMTKVQVKALGTTAAQMTTMMSNIAKSGGLFAVVQADQEAMTETGETPFTLELAYNQMRGGAQ